jgi:hypothetical protein
MDSISGAIPSSKAVTSNATPPAHHQDAKGRASGGCPELSFREDDERSSEHPG